MFEDFSTTEVVDGFVLSKSEYGRLATLKIEKKDDTFILVNSNQLPILNDFFNYAIHINGLLKDEYVIRAKKELEIIESRFKNLGSTDINIVNTVLSIDRYIVSADKEADVLAIQRPTIPIKVSPKIKPILSLSVVLGGIVGVFFVLVRNAITKQQKKLAKA